MKIKHLIYSLLISFLVIFSPVVAFSQSTENIVIKWNNASLKAVRASSFGPTIIARALAIVNTCVYDAWAAYDDKAVGTRLGNTLRRPQDERTQSNKEKAISYAAYKSLLDLFPEQKNIFDALMKDLNYDISDTSTDTSTPQGIGNVACNEVLKFRHTDGSNQLGDLHAGAYSDYTDYMSVNTPDQVNNVNNWQPLIDNGTIQSYLTPQWGEIIPFALSSASQFLPPAPPTFPSKDFRKEVREIAKISATLTDREKIIAEYWIDGIFRDTATGHIDFLAQEVSKRDSHSLDEDVKMFFALNNALLDTSIAVWDSKRVYDYVRPITAIRTLYKGKNIVAWNGNPVVQPKEEPTTFEISENRGGRKLIKGENWQPYLLTPPFPEYVSGHSAFGATGAEIFRSFTGSDKFGFSYTAKAGSSFTEPGITPKHDLTLEYPTFTKVEEHDGLSRLYGGIHFRSAYLNSRILGKKVAQVVWEKAQNYFNGTVN